MADANFSKDMLHKMHLMPLIQKNGIFKPKKKFLHLR